MGKQEHFNPQMFFEYIPERTEWMVICYLTCGLTRKRSGKESHLPIQETQV